MTSLQVVTATAKEWLAALTRLTPMTLGKKPVPILEKVLVNPSASTLFAVGPHGNAETELVSAPASKGAPFLVSYSWLRSAITSSTTRNRDALVEVSIDGKQGIVKAAGYVFRFETTAIDDFPTPPETHVFDSHISVEAAQLRTALDRALVASSIDDTIPVLDSVHFKAAPDGLTLWSTDRYRLTSGFVPGHGFGETAFTVPAVFLKRFAKQIKSGHITVRLSSVGNVVFELEYATYTVAGIESDYPKLGELFECAPATVMDVDRVQLLEAAKVANHMAERNTPVYLALSKDGVLLRFNDGLFGPDAAPGVEGVLTGDPVEVAFNGFYFLGAMNSFKEKTVRIYGNSPAKKFHLIDGGADTTDATLYRHIIMPVRMPRG